jgi:hypothetical protein
MSRSLLSHLNALEAAGALKRCNPRCECGAEDCFDEAGSVQGITLIMKVLGFMDDKNQGIGGTLPRTIDSVNVLPMGNYGGEVSDFTLIDEMAGEGRIRMGRFQSHCLERKRLGERLLRHRMELVKVSLTGYPQKNVPMHWKKEYKKIKGIPPKNYDLLKLKQIIPAGLSPLAEVWTAEEFIFLDPQPPLRTLF